MSARKWDWSSSLWASDSRQTTVYCLGWSSDEVLPTGKIGIETVPLEGQSSLADKFRLDRNEFREWAKFVKTVKTGDGVEIYLSIESIWLNWMDWDWSEKRAVSDDQNQGLSSYFGDRMTGELLRKLRGNRLTFDDLSERARTSLADKVKLDVREIKFWCQIEKVEEKSNSFIIFAAIPKVWFNSTRTDDWNWKDDGYSSDQTLRYYSCRGMAVSQKVIEMATGESSSARDSIPYAAWTALGEISGLNPKEYFVWSRDFSYTASSRGLKVRIAVPNVWISADLLRGGNWWWDRPVVNHGGTIGQFAFSMATSTFHTVECESYEELKGALTSYRGKIWGMVLFAHGDALGNISSAADKKIGTITLQQNDLIGLVAAQHYQLAKLCMMQCYSGYKGDISLSYTKLDEFLRAYKKSDPSIDFSHMTRDELWTFYKEQVLLWFSSFFTNCRDYSVYAKISGEMLMVDVTVNWESEWSCYVVGEKPFLYRGMNVIGIDPIFLWDSMIEFFTSLGRLISID